MLYPVNLIVVVFKLIPTWLPFVSEASIVAVTLIDVKISTPSPIVENLRVNGVATPVKGAVIRDLSRAPNFTLPALEDTNEYHVLGKPKLN